MPICASACGAIVALLVCSQLFMFSAPSPRAHLGLSEAWTMPCIGVKMRERGGVGCKETQSGRAGAGN